MHTSTIKVDATDAHMCLLVDDLPKTASNARYPHAGFGVLCSYPAELGIRCWLEEQSRETQSDQQFRLLQ